MKKTIFFLLAMLVLVLTGCGKEPHTEPLEGNPNLVIFTEKSSDGLKLMGVANPQSAKVIIEPDNYRQIIGDEYTICCITPINYWKLFKVNGEYIGTFEMVTPWRNNGIYYLGVSYTRKTYYFPKEDRVITTKNAHTEPEVLFLQTSEGWEVLNFNGKRLSVLPSSFTVIKDEKIPTRMWIAVLSEGNHPECTLYSLTGEVYKKLPLATWRKIAKDLNVQKTLTDSINITTTREFAKI